MLFRSTGLGKTELVAKIAEVKRQGDYIIFYVDTLEPVRWRIRAGFNMRDRPSNWFKKAEHPGDF